MQYFHSCFILFLLCCSTALSGQDEAKVYPYAYKGQWGIVQDDRSIVMEPQLDSLGFFYKSDGLPTTAIAMQDGKSGLISSDGRWLAKARLDSIGFPMYYAKNLRWALKGNQFGLLTINDKKAKWLLKPQFSEVTNFQGRKLALSMVKKDGFWGIVNHEGKFVAACEYDEVKLLDDYSDYPDIKLIKNGEVIYLDAFGDPQPTDEMKRQEEIEEMWGDDIAIEEMGGSGRAKPRISTRQLKTPDGGLDLILEQNGSEADRISIPAAFQLVDFKVQDQRTPYEIVYVMVRQHGKLGFWGRENEALTPVKYDSIDWQETNRYGRLAYLKSGGRLGLASHKGEQIFPAVFSNIEEFGYYFRLVHPDGYIGYASSSGQVYLPKSVILAD